ncbi:unnamed protein product, partial [Ectocarpus sp. 12 AP-2014]
GKDAGLGSAPLFFNGSHTPSAPRGGWTRARPQVIQALVTSMMNNKDNKTDGPFVPGIFGPFCHRQTQDKPRSGCYTSSGDLSRGRSLHVISRGHTKRTKTRRPTVNKMFVTYSVPPVPAVRPTYLRGQDLATW